MKLRIESNPYDRKITFSSYDNVRDGFKIEIV